MLYLHTSNQLEQLTEEFSKLVDQPLKNIFESELVVVQNAGMGRYLSLKTADKNGISANTSYRFPAEFTWELLRSVLTDISEQDPSSPAVLRWKLLELLLSDKDEVKQEFPELEHYLNSPEAIWDLSVELATALDKILFYRDDWVREWETGEDQKSSRQNWQARLWKKVFTGKQKENWLSLQDDFIHELRKPENISKLPERVSFFSLSALSPGYIRLLGEIGKHIDIHLFIINPSKEYWEDIESEKSISKKAIEEQPYYDVGNALLSSMGRQGRDFIWQFEELEATHKNDLSVEEIDEPNNLLKQIQSDIQNLFHAEAKSTLKVNDSSIQFHSCHTVMREVEVLHDQILHCLENDKDLSPSDIIVMMPDIDKYAPYIETIFSALSESYPQLPFSIADQNPTLAQPTIEALLKILDLNEKRFDVESVFELLDYESIRKQFNLNEDEVLFCREVARSTNIRWGVSANSRMKSNLPHTDEHTWRYALNRMLLGYTLSGDELFNPLELDVSTELPVLPYEDIEGSQAVVISHLIQFTDTLFKLETLATKKQTVEDWLSELNHFIKSLFSDESQNEVLFKTIDKLNLQTKLADFGENKETEIKIPFSIVIKVLKQALQEISGNEKFLGYGITFCALVPMRSVPFKIIALLGMNDGEYPRQDRSLSFDEVAKSPRKGDRSRRNEDRYLFLESILAARERLIISYIGQSIKDNSRLPPSVLVSELLDEICIYTASKNEEWVCDHPLQAFSSRYFDHSSENLFSYTNEYTKLHAIEDDQSSQFINSPLDELSSDFKQIHLDELIKFYQGPAKHFLKERFSISQFDKDLVLPTREPFDLESFKDTDIRELILEEYQSDLSIQTQLDETLAKARANGLLPYGEIGDALFNKEVNTIDAFVQNLPAYEYITPHTFSLDFEDDFKLYGEINSLTETGIVTKSVKDPYSGDYIRTWVTHLVLNTQSLTNQSLETNFYSPKICFKLKPVTNAKELLSHLIAYYWSGLHYPLHFYPKVAFQQFSNQTVESDIKKAKAKWNKSFIGTSEKDKFENWLLYRELDENELFDHEYNELTQIIFKELYEHYEEL